MILVLHNVIKLTDIASSKLSLFMLNTSQINESIVFKGTLLNSEK